MDLYLILLKINGAFVCIRHNHKTIFMPKYAGPRIEVKTNWISMCYTKTDLFYIEVIGGLSCPDMRQSVSVIRFKNIYPPQ